jgi:mannose/cellobiose epimerase-like protein (N-acyl-D-glucosamine 2-epimerase family)
VDERDEAWLAEEARRLLRFAEAARDPAGGFGRQHLTGGLTGGPVELWVTGRMTHVFALGRLLGHPGAADLVEHGLAALAPGGRLRDVEHGGWYAAVGAGGPVDDGKPFYQHCFVVLAAASATIAGHAGAPDLLTDALDVVERWFWDERAGMPRESWDRAWTETEPYRGVNATMHGVEAFLAAYDATGDVRWRDRAARMTERVVDGFAREGGWRIPEHFDPGWRPLPDYNRERPADPFRPYGATVGHALEWSRLCLHLRAALSGPAPQGSAPHGPAPDWLLGHARELFARAVADGWAVDGADGFVYTTDWDGVPVVRERMSWVAAEAVAAASVLREVTGDDEYGRREREWWAYIRRHVVDPAGAWHPELGPDLAPSATVWADQPEVYHAVQAAVLPRLPVRGSIAAAVADVV